MKILVMGLSGSGKSTFAEPLAKSLFATWINADQVRENYDDWDFSVEGRIRQSQRMKYLCDGVVMAGGVAVADFICPTEETRKEFNADFIIWMDTISVGNFEDTNKMFLPPERYNVRISKWIDVNQLYKCLEDINHGMKDTENFSRELTQRLAKLQ
jgi:adenylylsulfate kinase